MYNFVQDQVVDPGLLTGEGDPAMAGLTIPIFIGTSILTL